jgi:hypothetical protein
VTLRNGRLLEATRERAPAYQPERQEVSASGSDAAAAGVEPEASRRALALAARRGPKQIYWYVYQFAQLDPCRGQYRTDYLPAGVDRLLALERTEGLDAGRVLGCGAPKLRLAPAVRVAGSAEEAEAALRASLRAGAGAPTVIRPAAGSSLPPEAAAGAAASGGVRVSRFTLGELRAELEPPPQAGAWLAYADAWHPGWRVEVDGREAPVHEADLAFKAVWVPPGARSVRFWFDHGVNGALRYAVALFGAAGAFAVLGLLGAALLGRTGGRENRLTPAARVE